MHFIQTIRATGALASPEEFRDDKPYPSRPDPNPLRDNDELIAGVEIFPLTGNADGRGSLFELSIFDQVSEPVVHVYQVFAEPGSVRAWVYHKRQFDRLAYTNGEFDVVLYDIRADSATKGMINVIRAGEKNPCLIRIPPYVVHGVCNRGKERASFVNMPTRRYDLSNPDKSRLPKDDPRIPYRFE